MIPPDADEAVFADAESRALAQLRRIRRWKYEKEIGDGWVGDLTVSTEVPPIEQIDRVMILIGYKDRMVTVRPADSELLEIPALTVDDAARDSARRGTPAQQLQRWLTPICKGQWGIRLKDVYQHGRFDRVATADNTDVPAGSERFDLFLCATATRLDDLPEGSAWARRTITRRDFVQLIRKRYPEFDVALNAAHDDYVIRRERAAQV